MRRCLLSLSLFFVSSVHAVEFGQLRFDPSTSELLARLEPHSPEIRLGKLQFVTRRAAAGDEARLTKPTALDAQTWKLTGAEGLGYIQLKAEAVDGKVRLAIDLSPLNREGGLFRPVIELVAPRSPIGAVADGGSKTGGGETVSRADLGFASLVVAFDPADVARTMVAPNRSTVISWRWHSKVVEAQPENLFVFEFRLERRSPIAAREKLLQVERARTVTLQTCLEAWNTLLSPKDRPLAEPVARQVRDAIATIDAKPGATEPTLDAVLHEVLAVRSKTDAAERTLDRLLETHRTKLHGAAKERMDGMTYQAGLAFDADPAGQYDRWALFRMGLFRLAVNPVWHGGKDRAERTRIVTDALAASRSYGGRAVLSVYEEKTAAGPADVTFSNEFVPMLRSGFHEFGFNSTRLRDANLADFRYWIEATRRFDNVETYKVDNEPFWSTQSYPVFGYDEATVGCSPATFQRHVQSLYPSFSAWRARVDGTIGATAVPWRSWEEMQLPPGAARGLTFVAFLQQRYGTLERLNAVWGKSYSDWQEVFPPLVTVEKNRAADDAGAPEFDLGGYRPLNTGRPRPNPADQIAWRDWTLFWPHNINDELREYVALGEAMGIRTPVTTNCIGGAIINNHGDLLVNNALYPWITSDGLGAVAIDFYQPGYLQGYIRAITTAANGRPAEIHETGGSDTLEEAWFMTAYSFAYGARGLLFWRRDHTMPAAGALGLARAIDVIGNRDLQQKTQPANDGVAIVYPLETIYGEEARTGSADPTLQSLQGALLLGKRQQWQYSFPADRDLSQSLTNGTIRCAIFPASSWISEKGWQAVNSFVAGGGAVVVPADFALRDEHGRERRSDQRSRFLSRPGVHVVAADAFLALRKSVRGPERSMRFGLDGDNPAWASAMFQFVDGYRQPALRYVDEAGNLARTHAAARISDEAIYAFIDPWSDGVTIECSLPASSAIDLRTGEALPIRRTDRGIAVSVGKGATVIRLRRD